jgi:hypothetical protein
MFPLKFRVGVELTGASRYFYEKEHAGLETFFSADISEKLAPTVIAGINDYTYLRYRDAGMMMYDFRVKGFYIKPGVDFNLLAPKKAGGKYSFGVGIRYGITGFSYSIPEINTENYWGRHQTSIPVNRAMAHYAEVTPAIRAEIMKNISLGWSVSLRKMISSGTGKDMQPVYLPGYGNGAKPISFALSYFIIWSIPHRVKSVIIHPEEEIIEENVDNSGNPPTPTYP